MIMYLIQLFEENSPSCCSGVTKVFVDDNEDLLITVRIKPLLS